MANVNFSRYSSAVFRVAQQVWRVFDWLVGLLCHCLRQAGQHSGQPTGEVDDAVASVRDRLAHFQASVPPSAITPQEFALLARRELQEQWEGLSSAGQRLSPPLLHWAVNGHVVTLDQLLQGPGREGEEPPRVLAVLGEAGIGKSYLCRQVMEAWLQEGGAMEVVVLVELRQVSTRDLTRLLLKLLPQTCRRCHPEEVLHLLGALGVLWLLDGFEEASADALELLHLLVEWCSSSSGSHVVLVTCQPEYMEELNARLDPAATPSCVTHRGLTEDGLHSLLATLLQGDQEAAGEATEGRVEEGEGRKEEAQEEGAQGRKEAAREEVAGEATEDRVEEGEGRKEEPQGEGAQGRKEAAREATEDRVEEGEGREEEAQGEGAQGRKEAAREEAAGEGTVKKEGSGRSSSSSSSSEAGVEVRCQAFLKEVMTISHNLLGELHNPLKLALAVKLWEEGRLGEVAGASLTRLYEAIQEVLVAKLVARLRTKSTLTEAEARVRVKRWVAALCGEALAMWSRSYYSVALDEAAEQLLKDRAMELLLPYTDCFSVFLEPQGGPGPRHRFLHHTQLKVLAAQHVQALLRQDHTSQEMLALLLPGQNTTATTTQDHYLSILVHAATSLAAEGGLSEGRAKVLAELLQQCRHCPWVKVLIHAACCPALAREVRPHLTEEWNVTSATVHAAAVLAAIRVPASITINLNIMSANLPYLIPLLNCLAKAPVKVDLNSYASMNTLHPSPCDSLLLPLCDPDSPCCLITFSGALTAEGCRALRRQQHNLVSLRVMVLEPAALEELVQLTYNTKHLKEVAIFLCNTFGDVPSKPVSPGVWVHLCLMHIEDKEAKAAVALTCRISRTFKSLMLGPVSHFTVCRMVTAFMKEGVRTPYLGMVLLIQSLNKFNQFRWISFCPLPLPTDVFPWDVAKNWETIKWEMTSMMNPFPWVGRYSWDEDIVLDVEESCGGAE